ncbi:MAG: AI-2E family transporter [Gammaproteobacteria bacterium]|nr:AI-2E family transporter [Gammaproteobacteria bacterium]
MSDSQKWLVLAGVLIAGWLLYLLAPVLTPFVAGALLAYLGDPLVDRIESRRLSRTIAVVAVFVVMLVAGLGLLLVLLPLLERQVSVLIEKVPVVLGWIQDDLLPRLAALPGLEQVTLDPDAVRKQLAAHWQQLGGVVTRVLGNVFQSGQVLIGWLAYVLLIPVVTFYLLRDWDRLVASTRDLLPRRYEPTASALARECDAVLAQFMRGQLIVMIALGCVYSAGLWIAGLDLAFLIGVLAGLVSFVPYLGVIVGALAAGIAALVQFHDVTHLVFVAIVFGAGQMLEGLVLSPLLVGDRIGLHPVAVIFAVMAGGQLFGFFGVLLALPVAAVIVVLLRYLRSRYLESGFYTP